LINAGALIADDRRSTRPRGPAEERACCRCHGGAVAGCVDAVGYLVLSHVFTAHMSGNSVGFGAALGSGDWTEAFRRGFPIPLFVIGVATGGAIIEVGARRGLRRTMSLVLVIEESLLLAFMIGRRPVLRHGTVPSGDGTTFDGLVALLSWRWGCRPPPCNESAGEPCARLRDGDAREPGGGVGRLCLLAPR